MAVKKNNKLINTAKRGLGTAAGAITGTLAIGMGENLITNPLAKKAVAPTVAVTGLVITFGATKEEARSFGQGLTAAGTIGTVKSVLSTTEEKKTKKEEKVLKGLGRSNYSTTEAEVDTEGDDESTMNDLFSDFIEPEDTFPNQEQGEQFAGIETATAIAVEDPAELEQVAAAAAAF